MKAGLELADVALSRGHRRVVEGIDLALAPGRVLAILGPNGAGKSSLLLAMAGLLPPVAGQVRLSGRPIASLPARERARAIGYLPQGGGSAWNLRAREVVALGRLPHRGRFAGEGEADRAAVAEALARTDTAHLSDRPVNRLSGGERARVLLARVLAGEPAILLADEPMQNLDPAQQLRLAGLLRAAAGRGAAVAVVVHDLPLARHLADDALLLKDGRSLAQGPAETVLTPARIGEAFGVSVSADLVPMARLGAGD